MDILFLEAPYTGKVELSKELIKHLKDNNLSDLALYTSVQFISKLNTVNKQLKDNNINSITTKAKRTHVKGQLLGCDCFKSSLNNKTKENIQAYLYIGDGRFHPLALVFSQKDNKEIKNVICYDPMSNKFTILNKENIKTMLKKYKGSLLKFFTKNTVGVINTVKPGQQQLAPALALEKKYPDKKFYFFMDDNLSFNQLENFPFIDVWVNTACPRIGFDDQLAFRKGIVNLNDALHVKEILTKDSVLNNINN